MGFDIGTILGDVAQVGLGILTGNPIGIVGGIAKGVGDVVGAFTGGGNTGVGNAAPAGPNALAALPAGAPGDFLGRADNFQDDLAARFPRPAGPRPPSGASTEDRLADLSSGLQDQLDSLTSQMNEDMSPADLQKLQVKIQQIEQMMETISNILQSINKTKSTVIGNLRGN